MPVMDGFTAAETIRTTDNPNRATPMLALTANVMEADKARALTAGMEAVLEKPCTKAHLSEALEKWALPAVAHKSTEAG